MKKTAFITGATSGIGRACAVRFAEASYNLLITGRRENRLSEIKASLKEEHGVEVHTLCFDVQDKGAVNNSIGNMPEAFRNIHVLINNAGLALGRDAFDKADITDWETMMHTNVDGLLYVTRALMPHLKKARGHIINLGSVAGKGVYENGSVYCASKFAVDALTKSMRIDLMKYGIKVSSVSPGAVETEFSLVRFKGDEEKAGAAYIGFSPLTANDVADTIFYMASLPPNVCINDVNITCLQQADAVFFHKERFVE